MPHKKLTLLAAAFALTFIAAPEPSHAGSDASQTFSEIKKMVKEHGGSKLHRKACGKGKVKSKSATFAHIAGRRYKFMIVVDRGGQLHFVDEAPKRPVRTFFSSKHVAKFKISSKEVRESLKSSPVCFVDVRQDLDL